MIKKFIRKCLITISLILVIYIILIFRDKNLHLREITVITQDDLNYISKIQIIDTVKQF